MGITLFPFLRRVFPKMDHVHRNRVLAMRNFLSEEVDRHRKDFEPTNKRDFIDAFIDQIKARQWPYRHAATRAVERSP